MIKRYMRPRMGELWEEKSRFLHWLKVERAVLEEQLAAGMVPEADGSRLLKELVRIESRGGVDPHEVLAAEKITRHDVIAFTTVIANHAGRSARYFHFGLTSSDVVDTALSLQIAASGGGLLNEADRLIKALGARAREFKKLPTIGRTHGMFAEPTSFGLKFLGFQAECRRNRDRLSRALEGMRYGKLSGAVGASPHWTPAFEARALKRLGLKREPVSTQVLPRDRHAELMGAIALWGCGLERIATELRHLQRSEVGEALEGFSQGQKGSSAMPHKRNPISAENLTGCARMLRSFAIAGYENVALWHERDISHSSVERVFLPDAVILLDYALDRMTRLIEGLEVRKDRVARSLELAGAKVFSGHLLLKLVELGVSREDGYRWIQACALAESGQGFVEAAAKHPEIRKHLSESEIRKAVSIEYSLRHVEDIFREALREAR